MNNSMFVYAFETSNSFEMSIYLDTNIHNLFYFLISILIMIELYRRSTRHSCNDALIIDVHSGLIPDSSSRLLDSTIHTDIYE